MGGRVGCVTLPMIRQSQATPTTNRAALLPAGCVSGDVGCVRHPVSAQRVEPSGTHQIYDRVVAFKALAGTDATSDARTEPSSTQAVAFADLDGDGDLDILLGTGVGLPNEMHLNQNGSGIFERVEGTLMDSGRRSSTRSIAIGDLDGDGRVAVLLGNANGANELHVNEGMGRWRTVTSRALQQSVGETHAVAFAGAQLPQYGRARRTNAITHTGHLHEEHARKHACASTHASAARVRPQGRRATRGVNAWELSSSVTRLGHPRSPSPRLADIDNDGDLDIIVCNRHAPNELWRNDGADLLTAVDGGSLTQLSTATQAIALGGEAATRMPARKHDPASTCRHARAPPNASQRTSARAPRFPAGAVGRSKTRPESPGS